VTHLPKSKETTPIAHCCFIKIKPTIKFDFALKSEKLTNHHRPQWIKYARKLLSRQLKHFIDKSLEMAEKITLYHFD
jgi:hypothetical protein